MISENNLNEIDKVSIVLNIDVSLIDKEFFLFIK